MPGILMMLLCLTTAGFVNMNDEEQADQSPQGAKKIEEQSDPPTGTPGMKTMGGRQFWGDVHFFRGWRIQENVLAGHHRLLDGQDRRIVSGTLSDCRKKLEQIRRQQQLPPMSGKAVILIHGIGRSSRSFLRMAKTLAAADYTVVRFDYPSTRMAIPDSGEYLHSVLQSLEGIESIDVVAHSMGGLLLRAYLGKHQEPRFHRAVMLGVPNKGAQMADVLKDNWLFQAILGPAGQQLVSGSDGLIDKLPSPGFEFGVIAGGRSAPRGFNPLLTGDNDSTVTVASTRLPGATDFLLLPVIHSFLMTDKASIAAVISFLKCGRFDPHGKSNPISHDDISVIR